MGLVAAERGGAVTVALHVLCTLDVELSVNDRELASI